MQIGDRVKTPCGEGPIENIHRERPTDAVVGVRYLVKGVWWYTDQVTSIEPEKPKERLGCWNAVCLNQGEQEIEFCRDCEWLWYPSSYAERLQWVWGDEEPYDSRPICGLISYCSSKDRNRCKSSIPCEWHVWATQSITETPKEPPNPLYICDHAEDCLSETCKHRKAHKREDYLCRASACSFLDFEVKCIPVEGWFVMQHNDTVNGPYWSLVGQSKRLTENEAKEMARQWGGRAFKWGNPKG
jgi:hypothetical protein